MPGAGIPSVNVLGSEITITSFDQLRKDIQRLVLTQTPAYVCFATAHMIVSATRVRAISDAFRDAAIVSPDGVPVAWVLRMLGNRNASCVSGPRAMPEILRMAAENGIAVGFYGGRPETLRLLEKRIAREYSRLRVVYTCSPPFRQLSPDEEQMHIDEIRASGVEILFVGLGSPRQECWMQRMSGHLECVCLGVGAAFEFFSGEKHLPPVWLQSLGLTWLIRLFQEPRRLLRRNLYSPVFAYLALRWIAMSDRQRRAWQSSIERRLGMRTSDVAPEPLLEHGSAQ